MSSPSDDSFDDLAATLDAVIVRRLKPFADTTADAIAQIDRKVDTLTGRVDALTVLATNTAVSLALLMTRVEGVDQRLARIGQKSDDQRLQDFERRLGALELLVRGKTHQ